MKKRVIIIGGGAAGSMAALTAAQNGADVLLLEQNEMIGRKILSTGNGRCNFTNRFQDPSCYRSDNSGFAWKSIGKFSEPETTSFFENLGDERLHIDVYGDANYKQMTIRLGYVDEKSAVHQLTFHLFKIDKLWKIVLEE